MFPIELWNAYDRTIMNLPRSNNSIEGWHNAFAKRVAIVHPSVTKLAEKIRRERDPDSWSQDIWSQDSCARAVARRTVGRTDIWSLGQTVAV